jgi:hypothetical protein
MTCNEKKKKKKKKFIWGRLGSQINPTHKNLSAGQKHDQSNVIK